MVEMLYSRYLTYFFAGLDSSHCSFVLHVFVPALLLDIRWRNIGIIKFFNHMFTSTMVADSLLSDVCFQSHRFHQGVHFGNTHWCRL